MAYASISKPSLHFDGKIYLGSSSAVTVTGLGFQPDLVWVKDRDNANNHVLVDAVRGAGKFLQSNLANAEVNNSSQSISAFTSDGFTTGTANPGNEAASTTKGFMSWNWKANGAGSANTDGSINTTATSVNTTAGFSISTYTGTGSNATVGHGLGAVPQVVIARNITDNEQWTTYHVGLDVSAPEDYHARLNTNGARVDEAAVWNDTAPTSSVFSIGTSGAPNGNGDNHIAYCFTEKKGFSKFGSYTGNGNVDGPMIYTGFKPAFFIHKRATGAGGWYMYDNKRGPINEIKNTLKTEEAEVEDSNADYNDVDFLSNGVKIREDNNDINAVNDTYIYLAFAEQPLVANVGASIPATAR